MSTTATLHRTPWPQLTHLGKVFILTDLDTGRAFMFSKAKS